jgi:hypothetical protein
MPELRKRKKTVSIKNLSVGIGALTFVASVVNLLTFGDFISGSDFFSADTSLDFVIKIILVLCIFYVGRKWYLLHFKKEKGGESHFYIFQLKQSS